MKSKSLEYIEQIGKKPEALPEKYRENLKVMQEFAEIYNLVEPDSEEAKEAKAEYEDYDEKILEALKRDYPMEDDKKKEEKPKAKAEEEIPMPPVDEKGNRRIDKPALDALEAHLKAIPQTKEMHTQNGRYTTVRQDLHDKIITKELNDNTCIRREAPIAILTGGLPGSGKSTFIRKNRDWMTNPAIFKIDADEVRAKLPEYQGWNAPQTHQESRDIVNQLIEKIGANGCSFDVIYDGTMNKAEKYGPLIKKLPSLTIFVGQLKAGKNAILYNLSSSIFYGFQVA